MDSIKEQQMFTKHQKGQMGFMPQANHKYTSQSPKDESKLDICGET